MYKTGEYRKIKIPDVKVKNYLPYVNLEKRCSFMKIDYI